MSSSGFLGGGIGPRAIKRRGGLAAPVPVAGANAVVNGTFSDTSVWTLENGAAISGGVFVCNGGASMQRCYQNTGTTGRWYRYSLDIVTWSAGTVQVRLGGTGAPLYSAAGSIVGTERGIDNFFQVRCESTPICTIDNFIALPLTLSSLFSTQPYASANCDLSVAITRTAGTQAGLVARLDSATSPANFVIAYLDGAGYVKVDKCVAGVYTNVISGAVTYGAGKVLRLVCNGNNVSAYYNGTQVGSTVTVSDAGIVSNTRHDLFSTYAANSFAGYVAA